MNLIGDHTDYTGGLVFPMAIDRGTTVVFTSGGSSIRLTSDAEPEPVEFALPVHGDPATMTPRWGTYVAAMAREVGTRIGIAGTVSSTIPTGAGLSSSAALECALGLAFGFDGSDVELALAARRAEHAATGVPTGIMDQLCIASARAGHATLIDCHDLSIEHIAVPDDVGVLVEFVARRTLVESPYRDRVDECARAEQVLGPLRLLAPDELASADIATSLDPLAARRARHVVTENARVRQFADALSSGDFATAGAVMTASHASLRDDFDTSTAAMDDAVDRLRRTPGVYGARMTGGGFGGCVVALCEPGTVTAGWPVRASPGAREL